MPAVRRARLRRAPRSRRRRRPACAWPGRCVARSWVPASRNARAISSVVRPPSNRSVRATRASADSTGWQATNISRSRSSSTSSGSGSAAPSRCSISTAISPYLRSRATRRRTASIALRLAIVISHAPGLSGTPAAGHCSSAATSASAAASSASPTSWTIRTRPAIRRADSIRQTASIAPYAADVAPLRPSVHPPPDYITPRTAPRPSATAHAPHLRTVSYHGTVPRTTAL